MKTKLAVLSLIVLIISAVPASADMYEMDRDTAALLTHVADSGSTSYDSANIAYIGYNPGTSLADGILNPGTGYGADMQLAVGFYGNLADGLEDGDNVAWIKIGLGNNFGAAGLTGAFDEGYKLAIANDNQQLWQYKIYAVIGGVEKTSDTWTTMVPGTSTSLVLAEAMDFDASTDTTTDDVTDLGFMIQWDSTLNPRSDGTLQGGDDFHTSVVPVPAAMLLGLLGLGTAGLRLRRKSA